MCIEYFARKALRTILVAYKDMSLSQFEKIKDNMELVEKDFCALALFGLMDPLKPTVPESIHTVRRAHLNVIMCTGDNLETAKAIAIDAGIIPKQVDSSLNEIQELNSPY